MVLDCISVIAVHSYRVGMSQALTGLIAAVIDNERRLNELGLDTSCNDFTVSDLNTDSDMRSYLTTQALLLRKVRLHIAAVCRANESDNLHSLAVQMRVVLECAGQITDTLLLLGAHPGMPDDVVSHARKALDRLDTYYYDTLIRESKGAISSQQLLADIKKIRNEVGADESRGRTFRQENKVESLRHGRAWYRLLSKNFCHGESPWRGNPWEGSVTLANTVMDDLAFAEFMAYLAEQVSKVVLTSIVLADREWTPRVEAALRQVEVTCAEITRFRENIRTTIEEQEQDPCEK